MCFDAWLNMEILYAHMECWFDSFLPEMIGIPLLMNLYLALQVFLLLMSLRHLIHHINFTHSGIQYAITVSLIEQQCNDSLARSSVG